MRVLIVDDEESIRITLAEFIKEDGYMIETAEDAAEALSLMDKYAFDVIVTDVVLPRMDGVALLKMIRERSPDTQVIMLTGDPTVETAAEAVRTGAFDYLTKPVSKKSIRKVVANASQVKALTDEKHKLEEANRWYQNHLEELVEKRTTALRESEGRYRTTFESTGTAMVLIEEDMTISMVNEQAAKLSGYSKDDLEGKVSWMNFVVKEDLERMKTYHDARRAEGGSAPESYEFRLVTREGKTRNILLTIDLIPGTKRSIASLSDITERKQAEEKVKRLLDHQRIINHLSLSLGETTDLGEIYRLIYEQLRELIGTDAFVVSFYNPSKQLIEAAYAVSDGIEHDVEKFPAIPFSEEVPGGQCQVIRTGKPVYDRDYRKTRKKGHIEYTVSDNGMIAEGPPLKKEDVIRSVIYVPMQIKGATIGVLQVQSHSLNAYTVEDGDLLCGLANVAAVAIENARLHKGLRKTLEDTIRVVGLTTEMRDPYTAKHQQQVTDLACAIAREMSIPEGQIEGIHAAGLMHDIGKISIPAEILTKPAKLTDLEFGLLKAHPQVAYDILKRIEFPWPVADIILQHHERRDGSGYPNGLKGDEIMLESRILAVADVVEAMSSHRPYRPARGIDKALEEIKENAGKLYDPKIVDACLKLFANGIFKFADQ